jgi:hypothetical protein
MDVGATMTGSALAFGIASILMTFVRGIVLQMRSRTLFCDSFGPKLSLLITLVLGVCFCVFSFLAFSLYLAFLPPVLLDAKSPLYPAWHSYSDLHILQAVAVYSFLYVVFLVIDGVALVVEEYKQRQGGYTTIKQDGPRDPNSLRSPNLRYNGGRRKSGPSNGSLRDRLSSFPPIDDQEEGEERGE